MEISNVSDPYTVSFHLFEICGKVVGILPPYVLYHMHDTITKSPMSYKWFCKKWDIIIARIQVIQKRIYSKQSMKEIETSLSMHRNSIRNIMLLYESNASPGFRDKITSGSHFSLEEIEWSLCEFLRPLSRRPHAHKKQATKHQEEKILTDFEKIKVWAKKLNNHS
jgi:hypothetical protein